MKVINLKNVVVMLEVTAMASLMPALSSCTDEEVGAAIGAIAIGAAVGAAAAAASDHDGRRDDHRPGPRDNHGGRGGWRVESLLVDNVNSVSADASVTANEAAFAEQYKMSYSGAHVLLNAAAEAQVNKNIDPILNLGLTRDDLSNFGNFSMPSEESLSKLAKSLDQDKEDTRAMVGSLLQKAKEARQAETDQWLNDTIGRDSLNR